MLNVISMFEGGRARDYDVKKGSFKDRFNGAKIYPICECFSLKVLSALGKISPGMFTIVGK